MQARRLERYTILYVSPINNKKKERKHQSQSIVHCDLLFSRRNVLLVSYGILNAQAAVKRQIRATVKTLLIDLNDRTPKALLKSIFSETFP